MHLKPCLTVIVAVCILPHDSHALMLNIDNVEADICTVIKQKQGLQTQQFQGFGGLKRKFQPLPTTCVSDLCHEENTANKPLIDTNQFLVDGDILCQDTKQMPGQKVVTKGTTIWKPKIKFKIEDTFDRTHKKTIRDALSTFEHAVKKETRKCDFSLTEVEQITDDQHILFRKGKGYYTAVGKQAKAMVPHNITINADPVYPGSVMHELMHAMGFWHEHARPDRDDYITIEKNNIIANEETNFYKLSNSQVDLSYRTIDYDPCSILHYGAYAFAKSKTKYTISLKRSYKGFSECMGQRDKLRDSDVQRIRKMFACE